MKRDWLEPKWGKALSEQNGALTGAHGVVHTLVHKEWERKQQLQELASAEKLPDDPELGILFHGVGANLPEIGHYLLF